MVNRIQNRNPGYSDNIFKNPNVDQNPISSIAGATALKLDEQLEIDTTPSNTNHSSLEVENTENVKINQDLSPNDISIENASYIENNIETENKLDNLVVKEEHTPKLFSDENNYQTDQDESQNDNLFDQNSSDEEEFEIPAFLRKQKF